MLPAFTDLIRGLGDPSRIRMLNLLVHKKELCVCDLEKAIHADQPFVSRHLSYLKHSGWLKSRREGTWVLYSLRSDLAKPARTILDALRIEAGTDETLKGDLDRLEGLIMLGSCRSIPESAASSTSGG